MKLDDFQTNSTFLKVSAGLILRQEKMELNKQKLLEVRGWFSDPGNSHMVVYHIKVYH